MRDWKAQLVRDPEICGGRLTVRGTRVLVANILDTLAEGADADQVLKQFPAIKREDVDAALAYAADLARDEAAVPLKS